MLNARAMIGATLFMGAATAVACGSSSDGSSANGGRSNQSASGNTNGGSSASSNAGGANLGASNSAAGNPNGGNAGAATANGGSPASGGNAGNSAAGAGNGGNSGGASGGSMSGGGASGGSPAGTVIGSDFLCKPQCTEQQYCAIVVVDCGHNPCLVHAECRDVPSCTAANAYACPTAQSRCIDDGVANCTTTAQGKKCDGHCLCKQQTTCGDQVFDARPEVCGCVPAQPGFKSCLDFQCPDGYRCNQALGTYLCVSPT